MKNTLKKHLTLVMSMVLVVAMSIMLVACGNETEAINDTVVAEEAVTDGNVDAIEDTVDATEDTTEENTDENTDENSDDEDSEIVENNEIESTDIGEGETHFMFEVIDAEDNVTYFNVSTDAATVGEALVDCGLIEGEDSEYGLYVKTVNGITADYDVDQTYWAFYVGGEYATTGVDSTEIEDGNTYSFKIAQ